MAIEKKYSGGGAQMAKGEHKVTVEELKIGKSATGKDMLTITFKNDDDETVKGFYVIGLKFAMDQLKDLKVACGLAPDADGMLLKGKRCGIAVELGEPAKDGKQYMKILGYDDESKVTLSETREPAETKAAAPAAAENKVPF